MVSGQVDSAPRLFLEALVTILVIMDPVANAPVFLALTADLDPGRRRRAALQATVVAALLVALAVVYVALRSAARLAGVLKQNGIDLLSRVVGVLLAAIAVQLVASGIQEWVRHGV